jgi:hypothetical protein
MKIKKILYCSVIFSTVILSMGSAEARDVTRSEIGISFTGHSLSSTVQGSKLIYATATAITGDADILSPFPRDLDAVR